MIRLKQVLSQSLKNGTIHTHQTKDLIVEFIQIRNIPYAHHLFDLIPQPTVFLYNKLIQAYSSQNQPYPCLSLYSQMCLRNCPPNEHSYTSLFSVCAMIPSIRDGKIIHARFLKSGYGSDCFASTSLLDMYAKLRLVEYAHQVFDEMPERNLPTWNAMLSGFCRSGDMGRALELFGSMPERNLVSWTAMISGYSQNGQYKEALDLFLKMEKEKGIRPNEVTVASVLPACANLGALEVGMRIERYAREKGWFSNLFVSTCVLEMYARCGKIDAAKRVFDEIGKRRNLCSWNSMIMGFAVHGKCVEALQLYDQMLEERVEPDNVTFVGLILACTHGGMVERGKEIFESMEKTFDIAPKLEHYGCMVDLLGRAGRLQEAYDLIKTMPIEPDSAVWGALLGACGFHKNAEIAEKAAEFLFQLEPWNPGNYVVLSNIYAATGRWDGVAKLRMMMKQSQITKAAGWSLIEEGGEMHKFIVDDKSHPQRDQIFDVLDKLSTTMKLEDEEINSESELEDLLIMEHS